MKGLIIFSVSGARFIVTEVGYNVFGENLVVILNSDLFWEGDFLHVCTIKVHHFEVCHRFRLGLEVKTLTWG